MKIIVRLMSLAGPFVQVGKEESFDSIKSATVAVTAHAESGGCSHVKLVDEGDMDGGRWTARTPRGRGGRNVAFFDYDPRED